MNTVLLVFSFVLTMVGVGVSRTAPEPDIAEASSVLCLQRCVAEGNPAGCSAKCNKAPPPQDNSGCSPCLYGCTNGACNAPPSRPDHILFVDNAEDEEDGC